MNSQFQTSEKKRWYQERGVEGAWKTRKEGRKEGRKEEVRQYRREEVRPGGRDAPTQRTEEGLKPKD